MLKKYYSYTSTLNNIPNTVKSATTKYSDYLWNFKQDLCLMENFHKYNKVNLIILASV